MRWASSRGVSCSVDLDTGEVGTAQSIKRRVAEPEANQKEYLIGAKTGLGPKFFASAQRPTKLSPKPETRRKEVKCIEGLLPIKDVMISELFDGDLLTFLKEGRLNLYDKMARHDLFVQVLDQVTAYNAKKLVHRDVKLENILLRHAPHRPSGVELVLGDAGFATPAYENHKFGGSPVYFSPEGYREWMRRLTVYSHATPFHDAWSAGIVLLIMHHVAQINTSFSQSTDLLRKFHTVRNASSYEVIAFYRDELLTHQGDHWVLVPLNHNTDEYIISQLLHINTTDRWTTAQAAIHLRTIMSGAVSSC